MRYKIFHIHYINPVVATDRKDFTQPFAAGHFDEAKVSGFPNISSVDFVLGMPENAALTLVNKWNRQNAAAGFAYWTE